MAKNDHEYQSVSDPLNYRTVRKPDATQTTTFMDDVQNLCCRVRFNSVGSKLLSSVSVQYENPKGAARSSIDFPTKNHAAPRSEDVFSTPYRLSDVLIAVAFDLYTIICILLLYTFVQSEQ